MQLVMHFRCFEEVLIVKPSQSKLVLGYARSYTSDRQLENSFVICYDHQYSISNLYFHL